VISKAVIDCGFGDAGKGKVVSYLCQHFSNPLVIRFSGGQQAAHHVVLPDGPDHVFSNFGSGTLQGVPTYWAKYCTVDPVGILNELDVLKEKGIEPKLYIDSLCPVTTPFEKYLNVVQNRRNEHGSCQVGVGPTYQREEDFFHLQFRDLFNPTVLKIKLDMFQKHYYPMSRYAHSTLQADDFKKAEIEFFSCVEELVNCPNVIRVSHFPSGYEDYIFESSQGLLLDQHIGFFPHVSRGNFGTKNILNMGFNSFSVTLVTRAYQTRHGNGPMTNEDIPHKIKVNPYEENPDDNAQGKFRISLLDLDLLKYSIYSDPYILSFRTEVDLIITCLDLIDEDYRLTVDGKVCEFKNERDFVQCIKSELAIDKVRLSRTPFPEVELFDSL